MNMWSVFVYYDYLDPQLCERKEYRFPDQEMAEQFRLQAVEMHEMVYVSPSEICSEDCHVFENLSSALKDLQLFLDRNNRIQYKYAKDIQTISMEYLLFLIYRSECIYLEEENKMLQSQLQKYENEL